MPEPLAPPSAAEQVHAQALEACAQGDNVQAVELFVQAIALAPEASMYHRNLGELCRRLGRLDEAVLAGQHAVALEPRDADAYANLGLAWADQGAWPAAIACYQQALALNHNNGMVWNNLGAAMVQSAEAAAEQAFRNAIALNPAHAEALINLGLLLQRQGIAAAAHACLAQAEQAMPGILQRVGLSPSPAPPQTPPPARVT